VRAFVFVCVVVCLFVCFCYVGMLLTMRVLFELTTAVIGVSCFFCFGVMGYGLVFCNVSTNVCW